ncbi:hypothetical protein [Citrobacter sp. FDAARGOS_156]|uniref:hypothetical protein n=1 Tax=Citrobacter sp. FDAARGOS_156 TaxID=1702170 RepID=UPI000B18C523|nr:hypothetical protein [Citrobacter sp. FDAARGOS_156]
MPTPWEKEEFQNSQRWVRKSKSGALIPIPCIGVWMDVCGFGSRLEEANWNLEILQSNGTLNLLSEVYQCVGHPFWIGVEPQPYENILILNDGIARTVDFHNTQYIHAAQAIFYIRDLVLGHLHLLELTKFHHLGIRTVLAGGERIQYSPEIFTGNSILSHNEIPSEWGAKLLKKNFLYNPAEFQMNTAFAKAYSVDANGTKAGFNVNGFFIEKMFFDRFAAIPYIALTFNETSIQLKYNDNIALEFYVSTNKAFTYKGLNTHVYGISAVRVDKTFEGEETIINLVND